MSASLPTGGETTDTSAYRQADSVFSITHQAGIEHIINDFTGKQLIRIYPEVNYPEAADDSALKSILLNAVQDVPRDGNRYYDLPDNFVTMGQALNDAIGDTQTIASKGLARELFGFLGIEFSRIAEHDGVLPKELDYRNVILLREGIGIKVLPPLSLVDDSPEARIEVTESLRRFCLRGASNYYQRMQLPSAFEGFVEHFVE